MKNRLAALSMLDRAFRKFTDQEIVGLYGALDEDQQDALQRVAGVKGQDFDDAALVAAVRERAAKGRLNGDLERLSLLLTDDCLEDCIESLGNAAADPSEGQLLTAVPALVEKYGLTTTQAMLATVVCGEAVASPIIMRLLKTDETLKLPPAEAITTAPNVITKDVDPEREALKEQRKARKAAEQDAARRRREQAAAARRR